LVTNPTDGFLFAVTLADERRFNAMLDDVAGAVLSHAGYAAPDIADILGAFRRALGEGVARGLHECRAQFCAEAGQLVIVVTYPGGVEWRAVRPLPASD
jgi:hypothetical protein